MALPNSFWKQPIVQSINGCLHYWRSQTESGRDDAIEHYTYYIAYLAALKEDWKGPLSSVNKWRPSVPTERWSPTELQWD